MTLNDLKNDLVFQLLMIASTFTIGINGNSVRTAIENCESLGGREQEDVCDLPDDARVGPNDSKWCCDVDNWSSWDTCADMDGDSSCKDDIKHIVGRQTRYRSHICDGPRETVNCPDCLDTRKCDLDMCPRWAEWGSWSGCSQTCSLVAGQNGHRFRTRQCSGVNGQGYLVVDGSEQNCECSEPNNPNRFYDKEVCGTEPCPKLQTQNLADPFCSDWIWSDWSSWSRCEVRNGETCGEGTKERRRECNNPEPISGKNCRGPARKEEYCNVACTNFPHIFNSRNTQPTQDIYNDQKGKYLKRSFIQILTFFENAC